MKQYESAFLGLILAGVLTMVVGLGLLLPSARAPDGARALLAERPQSERLPAYAAEIINAR